MTSVLPGDAPVVKSYELAGRESVVWLRTFYWETIAAISSSSGDATGTEDVLHGGATKRKHGGYLSSKRLQFVRRCQQANEKEIKAVSGSGDTHSR